MTFPVTIYHNPGCGYGTLYYAFSILAADTARDIGTSKAGVRGA